MVVSSAQTYVGRKRAAVDQICVGVTPGEVKSKPSLHLHLNPNVVLVLYEDGCHCVVCVCV